MIFNKRFLSGIKKGRITVAYRRWKKPTVKSNGLLMTAIGQLQIKSVQEIDPDSVSEKDAHAAGYENREELFNELNKRKDGLVYRIDLGELKDDPRIALRESAITKKDLQQITDKLKRMDNRSNKPWTHEVLNLIKKHPGRRAGDLCKMVDQDKMVFKNNVRKLKNLGLTESLEVGYCLSLRGASYLELQDK